MILSEKKRARTYRYISEYVNIDKLKKHYTNISTDNKNLCIATDLSDILKNERKNLLDSTCGVKDERIAKVETLNSLYKILSNQRYYLRKQTGYNQKFLSKQEQYRQLENSYKNPFYITYNLFDEQFKNLENNSNLDLSAKIVYWSNKVVKDVEIIKENAMNSIINKSNDKRKLYKFESQTKLISVGEGSSNNLSDEYILIYKKFLAGKITKEELEDSGAYKSMNDLLNKKKDNGLEISHEQAFTYLSLSDSIRNLYFLKESYIEDIISTYAKQEESGEREKQVAIYVKKDEENNNLAKSVYNEKLTILIKDTNAPISVHVSSAHVKDMENSFSIKIPEGSKKFDNINLMYMKYNETQKRQIEVLNRPEVKSRLDADVTDYVETQYNMCNNLDEIMLDSKEIMDRSENLC